MSFRPPYLENHKPLRKPPSFSCQLHLVGYEFIIYTRTIDKYIQLPKNPKYWYPNKKKNYEKWFCEMLFCTIFIKEELKRNAKRNRVCPFHVLCKIDSYSKYEQ